MDIGLPAGTKDQAYLDTSVKHLTLFKVSYPRPRLIDAGIDVYSNDGLGNLELSIEGIRKETS